MKVISIFILFLLSFKGFSQKQQIIKDACSYYGEKTPPSVYVFTSDNEAVTALKLITDASGLASNFQILASDVPNAAAVIINNERFVLYNQTFMYNISQRVNYWASISILAHEIGHHLNGHSLIPGGSRPSIELEADKFSGFILAKLGASLQEAQSAINALVTEAGSTTHPGRTARLAAIANGWYQNNSRSMATNPANVVKPMDIGPINSSLPKLMYRKNKSIIQNSNDIEIISNNYKFDKSEYKVIFLNNLHPNSSDCKNPQTLIVYLYQFEKYFYTHYYDSDPLNSLIPLDTKFNVGSPYMYIDGICYSAGFYKGEELVQESRFNPQSRSLVIGITNYMNGIYGSDSYYTNNLTLWHKVDYPSWSTSSKMIPVPAFVH